MFSTFSCNHTEGCPKGKAGSASEAVCSLPAQHPGSATAVETARLGGMLHQPEQGVSPTLPYQTDVYYCASSENHFNVQSFQ